jgi:hypothetical protein
VALAVALELDDEAAVEDEDPSGVCHASCLPVTGRRPSIRPVRVAITPRG